MQFTTDTIFTEYDDSLSCDILRDPLGMQVIWSAVGQKIFNNKLTSISTDIRNFTVNLIHHFIVKSLVQDNSFELVGEALPTYGGKRESIFKEGLIVFLENIMVYSLLAAPKNTNPDSLGLLGSNNAAKELRKNADPELSIDKNMGVLVRQIQLGINGRYKKPFILMGFFNNRLEYPDVNSLWDNVTQLVQKWAKASQLVSDLRRFIIDLCSKKTYLKKTGKSSIYSTSLSKIPNKIISGYQDCFASVKKIPVALRKKFWLDQLGLTDGPAGALYTAMKAADKSGYRDIVRNAYIIGHDRLIENILILEPFLARINFYFLVMCISDIDSEKKYAEYLQKRNLDYFKKNEVKIASTIPEDSEAGKRLKTLLKINLDDNSAVAKGIYEYHKGIMESRGLPTWFVLENGKIRHISRVYKRSIINDVNPDDWVNSYYLDTLYSILKGVES